MCKEYFQFNFLLDFRRLYMYTHIYYFYPFTIYSTTIYFLAVFHWYTYWWLFWILLTIHLYFRPQVRDLGLAWDVFEYNEDLVVSPYRTIGPFLLFSWAIWTYVADIVFLLSIFYYLNKFFWLKYTWAYWYLLTLNSCIEMFIINFLYSIYETNFIIIFDFIELLEIQYVPEEPEKIRNYNPVSLIVFENYKSTFLWFPWHSFFNYLTLFGLIYMLTLFSIYTTDNVYYVVLYMIFMVFLFAANLVTLDLDIFAGLLLLIESVVILMLFFLIIYITPNINFNLKNQKWKVYMVFTVVVTLLSFYSYVNLGEFFFAPFSLTSNFLDDFYEALNEFYAIDLTGIFINLYVTNSTLLVVIGLLLLIASIICVVLVSFFTKLRNSSFKSFLDIFEIAKTCYSFIFLRKQNLAKQGRSNVSTRIFNKKTFDSNTHAEYKEKQDIFEQKKKQQ